MQVEGIAVPGKIDAKRNGELTMTTVIDSVKLNIVIDDNLFEKPVK
jgi:hypothetical protein